MPPEGVFPVDIGTRLRSARESAGITQAAAAARIRVARTTLVAIEKGQRRIHTDELRHLSRIYGTSANALLRHEAIHIDLVPRFRRLSTSADDAASAAATLLTDTVQAEIELENLLGVQRNHNYPPERPVPPGDVRTHAENDAAELRRWLGLGLSPIQDIVSLLELELGARVYVRPFDSRVSGLFAYDDAIGAAILLNANHPHERRTLTGAHELGHLVSARRTPDVTRPDERETSRYERYANSFARAFLAPARAVATRFYEITAGSSHLTRRHVILLSHLFGVSREAMVRRLEELALTKPGSWDWFQANGGITHDHVRQLLGDVSTPDTGRIEVERPTSLRIAVLAAEAKRQNLLSEGQLARLLGLDRVELRRILEDAEIEGSEADGIPKLSP